MGDNAEIYERLGRIEQTVARIDERTKVMADKHSDHENRIRALGDRIRALERDADKRKGVMAALSLFASVIGGAIVWLFKFFFGGGAQ